jgi:steroid delta-isomerase-like uncharacterized protein
MSEENKLIARRYFIEIMNMANMGTLYELLSPNFVFTLATHPEPYHGPDGFKELVNMLHDAFPDFYINIQDMVAMGDTVVTRWRGGGTHKGGPLRTVQGDLPASGRSFEIDGMTWHRIENGKIVESLANEDTVGLLMQLGVIPSPQMNGHTSSPEENEALVSRYFKDVMSEGRLEVIEEILDPSFTFNIPTQPQPIRGHEGFRQFVSYLRSAFPDIKFTVERQIADGNKVASRWMITGTHKGEFLGAPPTNHSVKDYGIDIFTIANGKIASVYVNENDFGLMQQLGMIPSPEKATT